MWKLDEQKEEDLVDWVSIILGLMFWGLAFTGLAFIILKVME